MNITASCPSCRKAYHLDASMRGRQIRCPNPTCREVFEVPTDETPADFGNQSGTAAEPAAPQAPKVTPGLRPRVESVTGSVGDFVPVLPAEPVADDRPADPWSSVPPSGTGHRSPEVGQGVPLLPADFVLRPEDESSRAIDEDPGSFPAAAGLNDPHTPEQAGAVPVAMDWHDEPPPTRERTLQSGDSADAAPPVSTPETSKRQRRPVESVSDGIPFPALPSGDPGPAAPEPPYLSSVMEPMAEPWSPPPVRRRDGVSAEAPATVPSAHDHIPVEHNVEVAPRPQRRRALVVVLTFAVATILVSFSTWFIFLRQTEQTLWRQAKTAYDAGHYGEARGPLDQLAKDYPDSDRYARYQFLSELASIRARAEGLNPEAQDTFARLVRFAEEEADRNGPLLDEYSAEVGQTFFKLAKDLILIARSQADVGILGQAERSLVLAQKFSNAITIGPERQEIGRIREEAAKQDRLHQLCNDLDEFLHHMSREGPRKARSLIRERSKQDPEFAKDPGVLDRLKQIDEGQRGLITWRQGAAIPPPRDAPEAGLLISPSMIAAQGSAAPAERVVFSIARGVLTAHDLATGEAQWATRVGVDTTLLPVRLPAAGGSPESVLVLSTFGPQASDLTRRDARTGRPLWHYALSAPALGRPAVVGNRVYVATYDGIVHEISIFEGRLVGSFDVGQRLTVGPVFEEGTRLLYVPADSRDVFVLDLDNHERPCQAILETGHPAGSLRGEPIIVSRESLRRDFHLPLDAWPDYLVLSQAEGLGTMTLRIFRLPVRPGQENPPLLERKLEGWPWFSPPYDGEKLVQVTDAGVLGLVGIRQYGNQDAALFMMETHQLFVGGETAGYGRAQVVHIDALNNLWVLAEGKLQKYHFDQFGQPGEPGPRLVPRWDKPLPLGSPLHGSQADDATRLLCLVTQAPSQHTCLATAVNMETGQVQWQHQLGMVCQGDPVRVGADVVAVDQGGGLFAFHPGPGLRSLPRGWRIDPAAALSPSDERTARTHLLPEPGGQWAIEVAWAATGTELVVRRHEPGKAKTEMHYRLSAPPGGTPFLAGESLLLPLADGDLLRQPLREGAEPSKVVHWRAPYADAGAQGHVVALGGDDLISTDGSTGLTHWHWPAGPVYQQMAKLLLPARITDAPALLPASNAPDKQQLAIGCADGRLYLVEDRPAASGGGRELAIVRWWDLGGRLTAGPFLRGPRLGCVVDRTLLLWLDPSRDTPLWQYRSPDVLEGQPRLIGPSLVLADLRGRYVCLDPETGKANSAAGYQLRASVAPAGSPVAFGSDKVLAPLSDGTALLLPLADFIPVPKASASGR